MILSCLFVQKRRLWVNQNGGFSENAGNDGCILSASLAASSRETEGTTFKSPTGMKLPLTEESALFLLKWNRSVPSKTGMPL